MCSIVGYPSIVLVDITRCHQISSVAEKKVGMIESQSLLQIYTADYIGYDKRLITTNCWGRYYDNRCNTLSFHIPPSTGVTSLNSDIHKEGYVMQISHGGACDFELVTYRRHQRYGKHSDIGTNLTFVAEILIVFD